MSGQGARGLEPHSADDSVAFYLDASREKRRSVYRFQGNSVATRRLLVTYPQWCLRTSTNPASRRASLLPRHEALQFPKPLLDNRDLSNLHRGVFVWPNHQEPRTVRVDVVSPCWSTDSESSSEKLSG